MYGLAIVFSSLLALSVCTWNLRMLPHSVSEGAVCLDGSPYGYYLQRGDATKWVIHIQGGGWCYNPQDCVYRSRTILGSSKQWPPTLPNSFVDEVGGILSSEQSVNPDFHQWSMIWLPYCDGGSFSGNNNNPLMVGNNTLYFRGKKILKLAMNALQSDLSSATEVIITGTSAGGLATFIHLDDIAEQLPKTAKVVGLADAGFFLKIKDVKGNYWMDEQYTNVVKIQNISIHCTDTPNVPPSYCFYSFNNFRKPLFIVNSMYDAWQLPNILAPGGDGINWNHCFSGFPGSCTTEQLNAFRGFHDEMMQTFKDSGVLDSKTTGLVASSCYVHPLAIDNYYWSSFKIGDVSLRSAFLNWYKDHSYPHLVDCPYLCNKSCR